MSKSKPGKHGSAKARIELEDIFTGQKKSHVGTVTDTINIPLIEKGSAIITHIQGNEVHAMDNKTYQTLILPVEEPAVRRRDPVDGGNGQVQDQQGPLVAFSSSLYHLPT